MANAERIEIDFNNANWQRDLGEINYDKIKEIELVNYNSNVSLSEVLKEGVFLSLSNKLT